MLHQDFIKAGDPVLAMNETEKNNNGIENDKTDYKKELLRLVRRGSRYLPGLIGGIIPMGLIGLGGGALLLGIFADFIHAETLSVTSIMAGLLFLIFGVYGLVKQAHALFLRMLAGGKK